MDRFVIEGGRSLKGRVRVSGAKNSALPLFAATLLAEGPCTLTNVPSLRDVRTMGRVLEGLGCSVKETGAGEYTFDAAGVNSLEAPYDLIRTMRASFIVLGPLLSRFGRAKVSLPGGCAIGVRQVDLHIKGLRAMGASIDLGQGYVEATADRLRGALVYLDFPSVGATQNLMLAAALARGVTVIENAAREPEIADLAHFLEAMGSRIEGAGTNTVTVHGVDRLSGAEHRVIPDRIEAGTFMLAAALTGGHLVIEDAPAEMLESLTAKLLESGASVFFGDGFVEVKGPSEIRPADASTQPHPGFPTDLQAPYVAYMCKARGTSTVTETIFENRFLHVAELRRLGASIRIQGGRSALIKGTPHLLGAPVMASDLRAGACLVLAGLAAEGTTTVRRVYHIDRGYERLEEKLSAAGARITREAE